MHLTGKEVIKATTNLKRRLGSLGLGVLILCAVYGFAVLVSNDVRLVYVIGATLLFCSAMWMGTKGKGDLFAVALLAVPLISGFGCLVLAKMPVLWPQLLFWFIAAAMGWHLLGVVRRNHILSICGGAGLFIAVSLWYCMGYVPEQVARSHGRFRDAAAPRSFQP
jgi:hypothetical protein